VIASFRQAGDGTVTFNLALTKHRRLDRFLRHRPFMRQQQFLAVCFVAVLLGSMSGCLGLIAARESVESLRDPAYDSLKNKKVTVSHEFTSLFDYSETFTNRSTFIVSEATSEVDIYFKASFEWSSLIPGPNETRFVRASLTDSDGNVQWSKDVSEDASPPEEQLQPLPSFALGEWVLDVEARGGGDSSLTNLADNFLIIVTITNTCVQYPLVEECH